MKKIVISLLLLVASSVAMAQTWGDSILLTYKLHGQTRRFTTTFTRLPEGGCRLDWSIMRNMRMWHGSYEMSASALADGGRLSYLMPEDGNHVSLPDGETFAILSQRCFRELSDKGITTLNGATWTRVASGKGYLECKSDEGASMKVSTSPGFPLIISMADNPFEINWTATW